MKLNRPKFIPFVLVGSMLTMMVSLNFADSMVGTAGEGMSGAVTDRLGVSLMTEYVLAFEVVGLVLVAALVGGVYLAQRGESKRNAMEEAVEKKPRFEAQEAEATMEVKEDGSN
ncbi:MAG: NADH-quinone oxidoreductase subunit J [Halobacteria archaeon]